MTSAAGLPRICSVPSSVTSAGDEAIEQAAAAGLVLDEWQQYTLRAGLGEKPDGKWSAFEVGVLCSRQNGKGGVIEARELAGLFQFNEKLIVHTAHLFDTALEAFRRLKFLIQETPDLDRRVHKITEAHGKEGIELRNGNRIRFRARGERGGGRGFSGDTVIFDEAMILPVQTVGDVMPITSARPNPQIWYFGSAVDEDVHKDGLAFTRVRNRGLTRRDPSLAWIEYSADDTRDRTGKLVIDLADPRNIRQANPAVGIRISLQHVAKERRAMTQRQYAVERMGIGYWPKDTDEVVKPPINPTALAALVDRSDSFASPLALAVDIDPDQAWCSIGAARLRPDGRAHLEVGFHEKPTKGLLDIIVALVVRWNPVAIVIDSRGTAGYLRPLLLKQGIEAQDMTAASVSQACVGLQRAVDDEQITTTGDPLLVDAAKGATKRTIGDGWGFARESGSVISPLVAVAYARHALVAALESRPAPPRPSIETSGAESDPLGDTMLTAQF